MRDELEREIAFLKKEKYHNRDHPNLETDIERLKRREPLAYVIGNIPFCGTHIDLSCLPLIPRPETEYWTEKLIARLKGDTDLHILDMCAGSGCIGVALLTHLPTARVDFAEKDPALAKQIEKNISINNIDSSRGAIYTSDLFSNIPTDAQYDVIVANPPYVAPASTDVQTSVRAYEPREAVFADQEGFACIERIFSDSIPHLSEGGMLVVEFDPHQVPEINKHATRLGFTVEIKQDQYQTDRWCIAVKQ